MIFGVWIKKIKVLINKFKDWIKLLTRFALVHISKSNAKVKRGCCRWVLNRNVSDRF